jgi:hypothetical protein
VTARAILACMRAIVLLGILAMGCEPQPLDGPVPHPDTVEQNPIAPVGASPIRVCVDVQDAWRAERVRRGVQAWAQVLAPWREVTVSDVGPCELTLTEVEAGDVCHVDAAGCVDTIGGLDRVRAFGTVYFVLGTDYEHNPAFATIHEVGHLLGLEHEDGGVMQAQPSAGMWGARWDCPDPVSIARLEWHLGAMLAPCPT